MSSISRFLGSRARRRAGLAGVAAATALLAACGSMNSESMGAGPGRSESMGAGGSESQRMGAPRGTDMPGGINSTDTNLERPDMPSKSGPPSGVKPAQ